MGINPSSFSAMGRNKVKVFGMATDRHPVEQVSWLDAVMFCNKLSQRESRAPFYAIDGEKSTSAIGAVWDIACRRRQSGNTHVAPMPAALRGSALAMMHPFWAISRGSTTTPRTEHTQSEANGQMPSAYSTCTAMLMSGAGIGAAETTTIAHPRKIHAGRIVQVSE